MNKSQKDDSLRQQVGDDAKSQLEGTSPVAKGSSAPVQGEYADLGGVPPLPPGHPSSVPSSFTEDIHPRRALGASTSNTIRLIGGEVREYLGSNAPNLYQQLDLESLYEITIGTLLVMSKIKENFPNAWTDLLLGFPHLASTVSRPPKVVQAPKLAPAPSSAADNSGFRAPSPPSNLNAAPAPKQGSLATPKGGKELGAIPKGSRPAPTSAPKDKSKSKGKSKSSVSPSTEQGGRNSPASDRSKVGFASNKSSREEQPPIVKPKSKGTAKAVSKDKGKSGRSQPVDSGAVKRKIKSKIIHSLQLKGSTELVTRMSDLGLNLMEVESYFNSIPDSYWMQMDSRDEPYIQGSRILAWVDLGKPKEGFPSTADSMKGKVSFQRAAGSQAAGGAPPSASELLGKAKVNLDNLKKSSNYPHPHSVVPSNLSASHIPIANEKLFIQLLRSQDRDSWQRMLKLPGIPNEYFLQQPFVSVEKMGIGKSAGSKGPWAKVSVRISRSPLQGESEKRIGYQSPTGSAVSFTSNGTCKIFMTLRLNVKRQQEHDLLVVFNREHLLAAEGMTPCFTDQPESGLQSSSVVSLQASQAGSSYRSLLTDDENPETGTNSEGYSLTGTAFAAGAASAVTAFAMEVSRPDSVLRTAIYGLMERAGHRAEQTFEFLDFDRADPEVANAASNLELEYQPDDPDFHGNWA